MKSEEINDDNDCNNLTCLVFYNWNRIIAHSDFQNNNFLIFLISENKVLQISNSLKYPEKQIHLKIIYHSYRMICICTIYLSNNQNISV